MAKVISVAPSGTKCLRNFPEPVMSDNSHNSEETILSVTKSWKIIQTNSPPNKVSCVQQYGPIEIKQQCLQIVVKSPSAVENHNCIFQNGVGDGDSCFVDGLQQKRCTWPQSHSGRSTSASVNNVIGKYEKDNCQIDNISDCHINSSSRVSNVPDCHVNYGSQIPTTPCWHVNFGNHIPSVPGGHIDVDNQYPKASGTHINVDNQIFNSPGCHNNPGSQILIFPGCHTSQRHTNSAKSLKYESGLNQVSPNLSWAIEIIIVLLLLLANVSVAMSDTESSTADTEVVELQPCLLHFPATNLVYTRHPYNCSVFYLCYSVKQYEMVCSRPNTVFSLKHRVCVWKNSSLDDCEDNYVGKEAVYFQNPALVDNVDGSNSSTPQISAANGFSTKPESQYPILTQQPLRNKNWVDQPTKIKSLTGETVNLYDVLTGDKSKTALPSIKQENINRKLQKKKKQVPESWYTFVFSNLQTLRKGMNGALVVDSTADTIKDGAGLITHIKTTAPSFLYEIYTGAGNELPEAVGDSDNSIEIEAISSEDNRGIKDASREMLSAEILDALVGQTERVLSGEIIEVIPSETEHALPGEIAQVIPGETEDIFPCSGLNGTHRAVKCISLGEIGLKHAGDTEVSIKNKEKNISEGNKKENSIEINNDGINDIRREDYENRRHSAEVKHMIARNNNNTNVSTNDREAANVKSAVTFNESKENETPFFSYGQSKQPSETDVTSGEQNKITAKHLRIHTPSTTDTEHMRLLVGRENNNVNEYTKLKRAVLWGSKAKPEGDTYEVRKWWLDVPTEYQEGFNRVQSIRQALGYDNHVPNKQQMDLGNKHVREEIIKNLAIPHWSNLEYPNTELSIPNFEQDNTDSKQQHVLSKKQLSRVDPLEKVYNYPLDTLYNQTSSTNWFVTDDTSSLSLGVANPGELAASMIPTKPTMLIRPWRGLSHKLGNPPSQQKIVNELSIKGTNKERLVRDLFPTKSLNLQQPLDLNLHTKMGKKTSKIRKKTQSISDRIHKIKERISNIAWLKTPPATPTLKNKKHDKTPQHTTISPKEETATVGLFKRPMWSMKTKHMNTLLPRHRDRFYILREKTYPGGYVLTKSEQRNNKSQRRTKVLYKQKEISRPEQKLQMEKSRKQNKSIQHGTNKHKRKYNKMVGRNGRLLAGRHNKHMLKARLIGERSNKDSRDVKLVKGRNNVDNAQQVRYVSGRKEKDAQDIDLFPSVKHVKDTRNDIFVPAKNDSTNRKDTKRGNERQVYDLDGGGVKQKYSQERILKKYFPTYVRHQLNGLLQQLQHLDQSRQRTDNDDNLKAKKQTQNKQPSTKQSITTNNPRLKSSMKSHEQINFEFSLPKMQLPHGGRIFDNMKLGNVFAESEADSRNTKAESIPHFRMMNQTHKLDEDGSKADFLSKQESKYDQLMDAMDGAFLRNIFGGNLKSTVHQEHENTIKHTDYQEHTDKPMKTKHQKIVRNISGKTKNQTFIKQEDMKIDSFPKLHLKPGLTFLDWEKNRRFSNKIHSRPKLPLLNQTTATTTSSPLPVTPAATKANPPTTATTTSTRKTVSSTSLLETTTSNTTGATIAASTQPTQSSHPETTPEYRRELRDRCGIMATPLIIGGRKSRAGQWPWQVSMQIVSSSTPWHRCGGVLIHARWVLTAAHCVEGPFYGDIGNWRVVLADYDLDSVSGKEIYRSIRRVISHPEYVRSSNYPNDVALVELDTPVDLTSGEVQTACLPDTDFALPPGTKCWISGWGETRGSGGKDNVMNEVPVDVLSHDQCKPMWARVDIDVLDTQVCLGHGDTGACYGDSGGPLMCESDGRFYVAGVMSWLINNCSATNFPNVFTRLPNYMDWLYKELDYFEWFRHL